VKRSSEFPRPYLSRFDGKPVVRPAPIPSSTIGPDDAKSSRLDQPISIQLFRGREFLTVVERTFHVGFHHTTRSIEQTPFAMMRISNSDISPFDPEKSSTTFSILGVNFFIPG
jgi:hypothetical protein